MTDPLKVLLVTHGFPYPPYDGDLIPIYHFLRCLAPHVRFTVLALEPADPAHLKAGRKLFEQWGIRVATVPDPRRAKAAQAWACLRHGRPWINHFFTPELVALVRQHIAAEHWDVLHSESILSAQHLPRRTETPRVLIARDSLSLRHRRMFKVNGRRSELIQAAKIQRMEAAMYGQSEWVMAISDHDLAAMREINDTPTYGILPNGVDTKAFRPEPGREEPQTVVFTGAMDYPPNEDGAVYFARDVWPLVRREYPEAKFFIVGRDPTPAVRALDTEPGVTVTGTVDRIQDYSSRATVMVSPLRFGTGIKNKVLEAAAMGKAMVATPVSVEGMAFEEGRDLLVAADAETMAKGVCDLLGDPDRRTSLASAARRVVEEKYSWPAMAEKLLACYRQLARRDPKKG